MTTKTIISTTILATVSGSTIPSTITIIINNNDFIIIVIIIIIIIIIIIVIIKLCAEGRKTEGVFG